MFCFVLVTKTLMEKMCFVDWGFPLISWWEGSYCLGSLFKYYFYGSNCRNKSHRLRYESINICSNDTNIFK